MKNKRIKTIVLLLIIILTLGCSKENKISCNNENDNVITNLTIYYKNEQIDQIRIKYVYNYSDDDAYVDMKKLELEDEYSKFNNIKGIKYKIKEDYSDIVVNVKIDNNELDKQYTFGLPFYRFDKINLIVNNLTNNNYTCN